VNLKSLGQGPLNSRFLHFPCNSQSDASVDPYGDLLDLSTPVNAEDMSLLLKEWTLAPDRTEKNYKTVNNPSKYIDSIVDTEFQDNDNDVEDDLWLEEVRNILELRRGYAIWSNRTVEQIASENISMQKKEYKKLPRNFLVLFRTVFLEKSFSLEDIKKRDSSLALSFRKWIFELRGKLKSNPLPEIRVKY
jgi:hypothetical protein